MKENEFETLLKKLKKLKDNENGKIMGCFPLYPPLELFYSLGLTPVVLWGLRGLVNQMNESDKHLQVYACSVSRHLTQFVLDGGLHIFDCYFFYNACDTLRNLPEIITSGMKEKHKEITLLDMHFPISSFKNNYAKEYLKMQINRLIVELERYDIVFSPESFLNSVHLYAKIRKALAHLENEVASGKMSYTNFSHIVCSNFFRTAEEQLFELEKPENLIGSPSGNNGPGVLISGIMPPPLSVIDTIEDSGLRIVGNDVATQRRWYGHQPHPTHDPVKYYTDFYSNHFPCPTLHHTAHRRIDELLHYITQTGAKGVIFAGEKYCEYEYFEFPFMQKILKDKGIHTLLLEFSIDDSVDSGALKTRIEAFAELLLDSKNNSRRYNS